MALFTTDYSNLESNDFSPLPEGEYEVVIKSATERATKNANRVIFVDEWKRTIDGQYKYKMDNFMHYLNGIGVPEGTPIESFEQLLDMFRGKPVRVYVKQEENEYKGEKQIVNRVAPWNFKNTKFPQVNHEWKSDDDKPSNNEFSGGAEIDDDDLPF